MKLDAFQKLCDRLNPYCRHALEAGVYLCRERTHFEVSIDHFLCKLLDDPNCDIGLIARAYGIDLGAWAEQVGRSLDSYRAGSTSGVHWTEDVIDLIERAWFTASTYFGFPAIRSGTILLALLELHEEAETAIGGGRGGGVQAADAVLSKIEPADLQKRLPELIRGSSEGESAAMVAAPSAARSGGSALEKFTVNYNELARKGKLDPALGRERELRQTVDIICRRRKNNAILVGEPGVGKTAVVEGLARRIVEGDVPTVLADTDILSLDLGLLQAGAGVKGEFENRIKQVLDGVANYGKPVILFIDEAHLMIGAGNSAGSGDAANLLKPALARGQLRTIAATTWAEYKKYFEKDAALQDRFEVVKIDEPDEAGARVMLRGIKDAYESHHGIQILESGVAAAVQLSSRYLTGRQLPRKAVDLLDTAAARVRIASAGKPAVVDDLERRLANLNTERGAKQRDHDDFLADHSSRLTELDELIAQTQKDLAVYQARWEKEREVVETYRAAQNQTRGNGKAPRSPEQAEALRGQLDRLREVQGRHPLMPVHLDEAVVAQVIADWTGIPVGNMLEEEMPKILDLENRLRERVRGQDHALRQLSETIRISKAGLSNPQAPIGVFLLVGPSGTGKTETALALAETLFGSERFMTTINMSEYKEEHTVSLLIGSPPGYVGYGEGGVLTEPVRQRPYNVVLLDEVEKANRQVLELFYQIFDKGYCEDRTGRYVSFRNTIILMTSNLDSDRITEMCGVEPRPEPHELVDAIRPTLSEHFKPALLARFRVIPFYALGSSVLREIVRLKLDRIGERVRTIYNIEPVYSDSLADHIAGACMVTELGARQLDHVISDRILPALSSDLLRRVGTEPRPAESGWMSAKTGIIGLILSDFKP